MTAGNNTVCSSSPLLLVLSAMRLACGDLTSSRECPPDGTCMADPLRSVKAALALPNTKRVEKNSAHMLAPTVSSVSSLNSTSCPSQGLYLQQREARGEHYPHASKCTMTTDVTLRLRVPVTHQGTTSKLPVGYAPTALVLAQPPMG